MSNWEPHVGSLQSFNIDCRDSNALFEVRTLEDPWLTASGSALKVCQGVHAPGFHMGLSGAMLQNSAALQT